MANIRNRRSSVPSAVIDEIHQKLALSKFADDNGGDDCGLGAPVADVKGIAKYWQEDF